jgi:dienelactone hydrolase
MIARAVIASAVVSLGAPVASAAGPAPAVRWLDVDEPGGEKLRLAVAWPEGAAPAPVIVVLHGTEGFGEDHVHLAQAYATAGLVGVAGCWFAGRECPQGPPFRGVTAEAIGHLRTVLATAGGLSRVRADRIGLFGHSRGATLALLAAGSGAPVHAIVASSAQFVPAYTATRRRVPIDVAPITLVSALHAPVLILHATRDDQVDARGAREYERALRDLGQPVEAHYYETDTHWLAFAPATRDDVLRRAIAFFRQYLTL